MEELVRGHGGKLAGIGLERCAAEFDGGGVGVLHAAVAAIRREVEEEKVVLERTVLHPSGLGVYDFAESVGEAGQVTKIGGGVDYDAVMAAVFDESRFLELAEFDGRVDEGVVVGGLKVSLVAWERRRHVPAAFVEFADGERCAAGPSGVQPLDVFNKVPDLVGCVPDW